MAASSTSSQPPLPIVFHGNDHHEQDGHAWKRNLPVGITFRPNPRELIRYYLAVRHSGHEIYPAGIICEADFSAHHPEELALTADDNEQELVLSVVYFNQKSRRE